ncbi:MAG: class I SAM-dependent methyltransferase [Candidatus Tectimicrobiota bacterium]
MSAIAIWGQRVAAHRAQMTSARLAAGIAASEEPVSPLFRAHPRRTGDREIDRLARELQPSMTLLDVGAGAGRFALPLALGCQHVTAVEPAAVMRESLRQLAAEAGIHNVTVIDRRWEEAEVPVADVVLSAHVIYQIEDIRSFVLKLAAHARMKVLMPTYVRPPMSRYAPFWLPVHGEVKHEVPGARELVQVLWELDLYPDVAMFTPEPFRALRTWEGALETLRRRLYVRPHTAQDARLQQAMHELLVQTTDGYVVRHAPPGRLALISWQPS